MNKKNAILKKLKKDIVSLERKIKYRNFYNVRNFFITTFANYCLVLDMAIPFFISGVIWVNVASAENKRPFKIDKVKTNASVLTIDTSNGLHQENISFDVEYDDRLIEYSTGWKINENNLYERTVTKYRISDEIDLNDTEMIFSLTKEEIDNILTITDIKTISKDKLGPNDYLYNEDAVIVTNWYISDDKTMIKDESMACNVLSSIAFILWFVFNGSILLIIKNRVLKVSLKEKWCYLQEKYKFIKAEDLEKFQEILQIKQNNLSLLEDNSENIEPVYKLRKK